MKRFYEIKTIELGNTGIKDFDFKSRTISGYFSRFGNIDHDGDMLMPGAFSKSIKERGADGKNLIPHLADHIMNTSNLLAKPKLYEVQDGGVFESTVTDTVKGIDILKQYRDGLINQHSFGFKILKKEDKGGHQAIKEVLLYEVSTVPLGANEETPFNGFKSMGKPDLLDKYKLLQKCYKDGDYSDDLFPVLEAQIKQIEQELIAVLIKEQETTQPVVITTTKPEVKRDWKTLLNLIN